MRLLYKSFVIETKQRTPSCSAGQKRLQYGPKTLHYRNNGPKKVVTANHGLQRKEWKKLLPPREAGYNARRQPPPL